MSALARIRVPEGAQPSDAALRAALHGYAGWLEVERDGRWSPVPAVEDAIPLEWTYHPFGAPGAAAEWVAEQVGGEVEWLVSWDVPPGAVP